jgi:ABC-2 type transport system permease protein
MTRLLLHQTRYDLRAFARNRQARFSTLVLPPMLLVVFLSGFGDRAASASSRVAGIAALGVFVACFANLAVAVATQRETGVLKRRRATPVPTAIVVGGRTLTAMCAALASTAAVVALGRLAYGVAVPLVAIPALATTLIVGSVAMAALAYALSTAIRSTDAAQPLVQAIALPLYVMSGVFVPRGDLPDWLREAGSLFPLERLVDGLQRAALHGGSVAWTDLAVLLAWTAAGAAIALRRFAWTPAITGA